MSDSIEKRIINLITCDLTKISNAYNEGMRLLALYNGDISHDNDVFACIKECQTYLESGIDIALRTFFIINQIPVKVHKPERICIITPNDQGDNALV